MPEQFEHLQNAPGVSIILGVLAIFLVIGLVMATDRYLYLHRCRVDTFELLRGLLNQLRSGRIKEAIANCDTKTGPVGEIFRTAIEHWNDGEASIRHAVDETGMLLMPRLERNLRLLAALANLTPIVGLIGTSLSLLCVFDKISDNFQGAQELSGDIKKALLCTVMGLLVSMVCQLCHAILSEKVDHIQEEMGKGAAEITFFLTHNPPPAPETPPAPSKK